MKTQSRRVIVAAEHSETRRLLQTIISRDGDAIVVGQAKNTMEALTMARDIKPDVAVIDYRLPHVIGFTDVMLSRIGGFDAAQSISREMPETTIVLLRNLDKYLLPESSRTSGEHIFLSEESGGTAIPFTLAELSPGLQQTKPIVFADVEEKPFVAPKIKIGRRRHKTILFTSLGTLGALLVIITMIFGGAIALVLGGLLVMAALKLRRIISLTLTGMRQRRPAAKGVGSI